MLRYVILAIFIFGGALGVGQLALEPFWETSDCEHGSILDPNGCPTPRPRADGGGILTGL